MEEAVVVMVHVCMLCVLGHMDVSIEGCLRELYLFWVGCRVSF